MSASPATSVLFICTGNVCRTPMAVGFFNEFASRLDLPDRATSVGLWREGEPPTRHGVDVMAERGIDTSEHRSRVLGPEHLDGVDLVIGLAREHVREAAVRDPLVLARAFTLKELVRLGEAPGGGRLVGVGETVVEWAERLSADRAATDLMGKDADDDVADPIGRSRRAYEQTAAEIGELVARLVLVMHPQLVDGRATA